MKLNSGLFYNLDIPERKHQIVPDFRASLEISPTKRFLFQFGNSNVPAGYEFWAGYESCVKRMTLTAGQKASCGNLGKCGSPGVVLSPWAILGVGAWPESRGNAWR